MKKYWFKAKTYGWGWYPVTWQGWLVIVGFLILDVGNVYRLDLAQGTTNEKIALEFVLETFLLISALVWICYKTGEKPGWRWGNKK
ncbi:hypothetical protein A2318_01270 [Candidatus Uhrbacteria bacterium RIFOXYB2_FULL_45_11]|uniref:Uncharacterized protein n=1 Tax=Candidatus Uhrbacteria bacterium RIFOXYB2_FULL_45_11 TaxID=1802421 RepID=A0A1F7W807_9BACT|nr:MAG: hypothetical protein A2318_01270 [Candidatus Uhrbacteria bacterium RIFOXYB2_FULL_45_11]